MKLRTFKKGGIHPDPAKLTAGMPIIALDLPRRVVLPLSQHIGAPAVPCVAPGERVVRGQMVARAAGVISAAVHTPISGTVRAIAPAMLVSGQTAQAITVETDDTLHADDTAARRAQTEADLGPADRTLSETLSPDQIRRRVADSGIVGLGGATFPSTVKLTAPAGTDIDTLIINACECEPYLTCDDALIRACAPRIAEGIELMLKASGAHRAVIGIEDNKPEAIAALRAALDDTWPIDICVVRTRYPQGGEKQLTEAVTGRRIPSGALPSAVGVIVNNVATAFAVYAAVDGLRPLTDRVITVTGDTPVRGNYLAAVGTPLSDILTDLPPRCKVIVGGPMMGRTAASLDGPVTKGTSGLLVLGPDASLRRSPEPCIRCGRCVDVCPMGLEPYLISTLGRLHRFDEAAGHHVLDCIECGSCSYTCPASRPILDYIRTAKSAVSAALRARKSTK